MVEKSVGLCCLLRLIIACGSIARFLLLVVARDGILDFRINSGHNISTINLLT